MTESKTESPGQLPEDVGRRPEAPELGPYAEFFFDPNEIPRLLRPERVDFLHWRTNGSKSDYGENTPPRLYFFAFVDSFICNHYYNEKNWNNGTDRPGDLLTKIPLVLEIIVWVLMGIGVIDLIAKNILPQHFSPWYYDLGIVLGVVLALYRMRSPRFLDPGKEVYPDAAKKFNNRNIEEFVWARNQRRHAPPAYNDEDEESGVRRKAFSFLAAEVAGESPAEKSFYISRSEAGKSEIASADRYRLALLRRRYFEVNPTKERSYALWFGWGEEDIECYRKEDKDITENLVKYIRSETEHDLLNSLDRVMDDADKYLLTLTENPKFWLKRGVTVKENGSDSGIEMPFLDWVNSVMLNQGVHYLVSEAAKGKSTTLNLLTLHHLHRDSGIWPLRIKLRDFSTKKESSNQRLISRVKDYYEKDAGEAFQFIRERFESIRFESIGEEGKDPPLLILDGLDEITREAQEGLFSELRKISGIPIIVVTRQLNEVTKRQHAVLGGMTSQQRNKVMRNLDLEAGVLREMEGLMPEALIDRPFALLIAADILRKEEPHSLESSDIDLSMSLICKTYEKEYFEREKRKRNWKKELWNTGGYIEPLKATLDYLALHHVRNHAPPQRDDPGLQKLMQNLPPLKGSDFIDEAIELKIIDRDLNLIDGWLAGYYAARSDGFDKEVWDAVLNDVDQDPDSSELLIRHFVASAHPDHTPRWNKFEEFEGIAPVVMDIASQEWLAMDTSARKNMMGRLGIPCDDDGRMNFPDTEDFVDCRLPELLALLHFHCSIADTKEWHSPGETIDTQWERLFSAVVKRYLSEAEGAINRIYPDPVVDGEGEVRGKNRYHYLVTCKHCPVEHTTNIGTVEDPDWRPVERCESCQVEFNRLRMVFLTIGFAIGERLSIRGRRSVIFEELFGKEKGGKLERARKLIPFKHDKSKYSLESLYTEDAVPSSLLGVIDRSLGGSMEVQRAARFAVGMIEVHADRDLFKLSRSVLEEYVPSALDIEGEAWDEGRFLILRLIGYRSDLNNGIVDYSNADGISDADDQWKGMRAPDSSHGTLLEISVEEGGYPEEGDDLRHKLVALGVRPIGSDEEYTTSEENRRKLNFVDCDLGMLDLRETPFGQPTIGVRLTEWAWSPFLCSTSLPDGDSIPTPRRDLLPSLDRLGKSLTLLYAKIAKPPTKWKKANPDGDHRAWWEEEADPKYMNAPLPSEDPRLQARAAFFATDVIVTRPSLKLVLPPNGPYLLNFNGSGTHDNRGVGHVIPINRKRDTPPSFSMCVDVSKPPQGNSNLAKIHKEFSAIKNAKFRPDADFETLTEKLKKIGVVTVYLKGSRMKMRGGNEYRHLFVPGLEWWNPLFSDLTFEFGPRYESEAGEIEQAFSSLFSGIPGATEDAHLYRWYRTEFELGFDSRGYRSILPIPRSIVPLCQWCAAESIEIEGDPNQKFVCEECSRL